MKTKIITLLLFTFLANFHLKAQNCAYSDLYGWATQGSGCTGGQGGSTVEVKTLSDLKTQASKSGKLIILVNGKINGSFSISSNKTVIGLPGSSVAGISISGQSNIIVRNLIVRQGKCDTYDDCKSGSDAVSLNNAKNVWLDHLDVADGQDGNCDITNGSDLVTVSWCKFSYTYEKEHAFSNLNGSADDLSGDVGKLNITFHHNWWADRIMERQPRVRYGKIHVANNLYTSQKANYLVGVGMTAKVLVEGNVMKATGTAISIFPNGSASDIVTRNNVGPADANTYNGTAFTPPYKMPIEDPSDALESILKSCAGATLADPRTVNSMEVEVIDEKMAIYPNPCRDVLHLTKGEELKGEIADLQGQRMMSFEQVADLDVSHLRPGMYFVRYQRGEEVFVAPIQKME